MRQNTTDAIALVTGANKGIGRGISRQLGTHGMTVFASARNEARGTETVQELQREGIDARFLQIDVTDTETIETAAAQIKAEFGKLDILVNNAGITTDSEQSSETTAEAFRRVYETNVIGVVAMIHTMLPLLRQSSSGHVVNISSPLGSMTLLSDEESYIAGLGMLPYCSSKAALNAITIIYANELRDTNILVNAVSPGYVATDLNDHDGELAPEQGARVAVEAATLPENGPTGQFFSNHDPTGWALSDDGRLPW